MFDLETILNPKSLDEALALLEQHKDAKPLAGGQNLLKDYRSQELRLVSLSDVVQLRGVWKDEKQNLVIGATTTFSDLLENELIKLHIPAIADTVCHIGNIAFRNKATVGGNLCKQGEFCELAAVFRAYEAYVQLQSTEGSRLCNIAEFFDKDGKTAVAEGELVTAVIIESESLERMYGATTYYAAHNTPAKNFMFCSANVSLSSDRVRIERLRLAFCSEGYPSCRLSEAEILAEGSGIFPADISPIITAILHSIPSGKQSDDDHEFLVHLIREQTKQAINRSIELAKKQ